MKNLIKAAAALLTAFVAPQGAAQAVEYSNVKPLSVHSQANACVGFRLEGVSVADPAVSGGPWIALAKNHPNFSEMFAILMTAKASNRPINVITEGSACGAAAVWLVSFE